MASQNNQTDLLDRIRELEKVCAELYRVIGSLAFVCPPANLGDAGITSEDLEKALDRAKNAAEGNLHKSESLLPWPASTRPEAQNETADTPKQGEHDKPHHKLSWWTENFFEASNVRGVQFPGVFSNPPDKVWEVASVYVDKGILMIAITDDDVVQEVPVDFVVPVFERNHGASGRRDEKDEDELDDMIALAKERLINEMEETENKPVDPTPANPRTYLPDWAWPEYWQPNQKKAVVVEQSPGFPRDPLEPAIGDVYEIEFAVQRSPDGQALLSFINRKGRRSTLSWEFFVPLTEEE